MQDKPVIDGIECRYWFRVNPRDYRKCSLRGGKCKIGLSLEYDIKSDMIAQE